MKLSAWLNSRAAIGSMLSTVTLVTVASGIVSCSPSGDERVREANEDVEDRRDNDADDEDSKAAPNEADRDSDDD